jgi:uncharacterized protein YgiM (DUF1202 family)
MKRFLVLLLFIVVLGLPASSTIFPVSIFPVSIARADDPEPVSIVIFREADTLTLYLPGKGLVSLEGLTIEATAIDGTKLSVRLDQFTAFRGLPFDRIVTPACFILESNLKTSSMPLECRQVPPERVFTERLTPANMIWYDSVADEPRLIFITRDSESYGQCPATLPQCEIIYTPPPRADVPPTTAPSQPDIKVIPITGRAIVQKSTPFRSGPGPQYEIIDTVKGGTYDITGKNPEGSYYRVNYNGKDAWVTAFAQTVIFKVNEPTPDGSAKAVPLDATLTYGQTVDGELQRNEKTNYKFIGIAGETISVVVDGKFDGYLELHAADGFTLYEDDNSGGNGNPRIDGFLLPKSGEYRIVLRGYSARDTGKFRLTLLKGSVPKTDTADKNSLKYGQKITDNLAANGQAVRTFQGTKGDVISVTVQADFDSYLQIQDASGTVLTSDDDSGGELNPLIDLFELPNTGEYRIVLRGKSARSFGTYTLALLQGITGDQINIKYGTAMKDRLESAGRKIFVFEGTAKDRITVTVECKFDGYLVLRDEHGAVVAEDDDSGGNLQPALMDVRLPATGTYFLVVTGKSADDSGPFTITLSAR